jgi:formate--tetrahydrofolate ligase
MDMNDRALRHAVLGLGGKAQGVPREAAFDITAASELMAILCLARDMDDLRARIDRTLIGYSAAGAPVTAEDMQVTGAMLALMRDAMVPNLVQTMGGTPAMVHGGPFANIAHGCNSVLATKTALHLADWVVTEAGFGFDLGAEKFFHIKCRSAGLDPDAVVLVASVRALKLHGGQALADLNVPDPGAVERGLANLHKHIENVSHFKGTPIVALNRFASDTDEEIEVVRASLAELGVSVAVCEHFAHGGEGALDLARAVVAQTQTSAPPLRYLYDLSAPVADKIHALATQMYGADGVSYTSSASRDLAAIARLGYGDLPVCIAKTPASLSDNPKLMGRPKNFDLTVRNVQINAGAGFLVVLTGDIMRMPGLPRKPRAERLELAADGAILGLE